MNAHHRSLGAPGRGRRAARVIERLALLALLTLGAGLTGCASRRPPPEPPAAAPAPIPVPPPAPPLDVKDGHVWSPDMAAVARELQQLALDNGQVEVMRTASNQVRVRIDAADAVDRRDALQPRFRRFVERAGEVLARAPAVRVRVEAGIRANSPVNAVAAAKGRNQALGWARGTEAILASRGVPTGRLTAEVRSGGDAESAGNLDTGPRRFIELLAADPIAQ